MKTVNNSTEQTKKSINSADQQIKNPTNKSPSFSNFNFIAPYYDFFQKLVFGNKLTNAQAHFLPEISTGDNVLIIGGGNGEIISSISKAASPRKIIFVEQSYKMIDLAKTIEKEIDTEFVCENVLGWNSTEKFEVIVLPFVLDCFSSDQIIQILQKLKPCLKEEGQVIFTDFIQSNLLVSIMYFFFRISASVKVKKLPDFELAFNKAGFKLKKRKYFFRGLVETRIYKY